MKKYQYRYVWYCSIATAIIVFVILGMLTNDFIYAVFSDWRIFLNFCIPVISVIISSFISFGLLYTKGRLAKRWLVGILNFILSHIIVFIIVFIGFYIRDKEAHYEKIHYEDALGFITYSVIYGGIFTLCAFIILAYRAYPLNKK